MQQMMYMAIEAQSSPMFRPMNLSKIGKSTILYT